MTAWACAETSANMGKDWHCLFGKGTNKPHSPALVFLSTEPKKSPSKGAGIGGWNEMDEKVSGIHALCPRAVLQRVPCCLPGRKIFLGFSGEWAFIGVAGADVKTRRAFQDYERQFAIGEGQGQMTVSKGFVLHDGKSP
jgi:hypothetical protein